MQNDLISKLQAAPNYALLSWLVKLTLCNVPNDLTEVFRSMSFILTSFILTSLTVLYYVKLFI